jgi:GNAT superfamily N-acetyltransferase
MDRDRVLAIQRRALRDCLAMVGGSAPSSRVLTLDGVFAAIVPSVPRRSIPNSVTYEDEAALEAALGELAAAYDDAGIEAWNVWAPEFDAAAIAALERAGHRFDGKPSAMVLDLDRFDPPDVGGLDYDDDADMATVGRVNDAAYDYGADGMAPLFTERPDGLDLRLYRARLDGEVASVLATIDHDPVDGADGPDCGIYWVATLDTARGRGLATRLLAAALVEARGRGCATSSLQSSALGQPIYEALGYDAYFRFHLYERRRSAEGG